MTPEQLDELDRLLREAPGPWRAHGEFGLIDEDGGSLIELVGSRAEFCTRGDRDLIVALRNHARKLIEAARENAVLRSLVAEAEEPMGAIGYTGADNHYGQAEAWLESARGHGFLTAKQEE